MTADYIVLIGIKASKLTRQPFGGSASTVGSGTPTIISGYRSASMNITNGLYTTVGSLKLPAGNWLVEAKAFLKDASPVSVSCTLTVGELQSATYSDGAPAGKLTGLYTQTGAKLSSPYRAVCVRCTGTAPASPTFG